MHIALILGRHWLAANALDDEEHEPTAVQCRQRQQIHHAEVDRDKCHKLEERDHAVLGGIRHDLGHADRTGKLIHADLSADEHAHARPDEPRVVDGGAHAHTEMHAKAVGQLRKGDADALVAVCIGDCRLQLDGRQRYLFTLSAHGNLMHGGRSTAERGLKVAAHKDVVAVDLENLVARLQVARCGAGRVNRSDRRDDIAAVRAVRLHDRQHDEESHEEIHQRTRGEDDELFPEALVAQRARVVGGLLLALHRAEAADGQQAQCVGRLPLRLFQDRRPHADGKLIDAHAAGLGRAEVAQLMQRDQHAENQDGC